MNWKKINLYILISFAFSWTIALIMGLSGIRLDSTPGIIMLAVLYMPGPALACFVIQKYIYREGFKEYGWAFDKKQIKWIIYVPLIFLALTICIFAIIGLLGNTFLIPEFGQLDFSQTDIQLKLKELAGSKIDVDKVKLPDIPTYLLFILMLVQGIVGGATINVPFMFGEELGWRGLMLKETKSLGFIKSAIFIGLVWGIWHFPVILLGHNYPHHPYLGIIMMILFTTSVSPLFAYVRIKTKSILGSCMLHGMINATGAMYVLYVANGNELYSSIAGWAGIISGVIATLCILIFDRNFWSEYKNFE